MRGWATSGCKQIINIGHSTVVTSFLVPIRCLHVYSDYLTPHRTALSTLSPHIIKTKAVKIAGRREQLIQRPCGSAADVCVCVCFSPHINCNRMLRLSISGPVLTYNIFLSILTNIITPPPLFPVVFSLYAITALLFSLILFLFLVLFQLYTLHLVYLCPGSLVIILYESANTSVHQPKLFHSFLLLSLLFSCPSRPSC